MRLDTPPANLERIRSAADLLKASWSPGRSCFLSRGQCDAWDFCETVFFWKIYLALTLTLPDRVTPSVSHASKRRQFKLFMRPGLSGGQPIGARARPARCLIGCPGIALVYASLQDKMDWFFRAFNSTRIYEAATSATVA